MTQASPFFNVKALLAFFQAHPDVTFSAEEICEATGIPVGSLHSAFKVVQRGHKQATQPSRGFYRWESAKPKAKPVPNDPPKPVARGLFELIGGPTSSGELVLQSDSGDLFLARKL